MHDDLLNLATGTRMSEASYDRDFEALLDYLKDSRSCDLTVYKRSTLSRRFKKRMQAVRIEKYSDYLEYLKLHAEELVKLFNTILINVTAFFRDRDAWDYLADTIIPRILACKEPTEPIRVWSAGCASGEEAYTLAILLAEALGREQFLERVKIYATDVDEDAIRLARRAKFSQTQVADIPSEILENYFEQTAQHYVFDHKLRDAIVFGSHDLISDAPISQVDLLTCRNALMYFNTEAQEKIVVRFHFALRNNGFLFLGNAEALSSYSEIFTLINLKHKVFIKRSRLRLREGLLLKNRTSKKEVVYSGV